MIKKNPALIFTAIILLVVITASIVITLFISRSKYPNLPDPVYEITVTPILTQNEAQFSTPTSTSTPTPVTLEQINCTYPAQYWVYWSDQLNDLGVMLAINQAQYPPLEFIELISKAPDETTAEFLRQLFAAHLNLQQGANPASIQTSLNEADGLFDEIVQGKTFTSSQTQITELTKDLKSFNQGAQGPGLCPGADTLVEPTATLTMQFTPTPEISATPSPTATPTVTRTPRPVTPTFTPTRTKQSPDKPLPTKTPVPPTATVIPTEAPSPTPE